MDINQYSPRSGRVIRENNEILNELDLLLDQNSDAGTILTTTPLAGGASYTQAGQDRLNRSPVVNRVKGEVWADQAGTLYLEESKDNSTWTATRTVAVSAGVTAQIPWTILMKRYFRFRYVNEANAQTGFILVQQMGGPGMRNTVLTGSIETVNIAPVVGVKTVTATAAEVFAGASVKPNRRKLILKNEDSVLRFRIGPSSVTQQNGFPIEPGAVIEFQFDPAVAVPIYAISEGASLQVAVMEV